MYCRLTPRSGMKEIEKRFNLLSMQRKEQNKILAMTESIRELNDQIGEASLNARRIRTELSRVPIHTLAYEIEPAFKAAFGQGMDHIRSLTAKKITSDVRRAFCHYSVHVLGYSASEISVFINRSKDSVKYMVKKNDEIMKTDQEYRLKYGRLAAIVAVMAIDPETC